MAKDIVQQDHEFLIFEIYIQPLCTFILFMVKIEALRDNEQAYRSNYDGGATIIHFDQ